MAIRETVPTNPETLKRPRFSRRSAVKDSRMNLIVWILLGLQFIGLLIYSLFQYSRFSLGIDFAIYNQALTQIAHGRLNPTLTIEGYPFLRSHLELIMWPLSLLYFVFRTPFVLLVAQDASLVGTGVVAYSWIARLVESRRLPKRTATLVLSASLLLILVNPLVYYTAALDFHLEATATFFAVLASYQIWSAKYRAASVSIAFCLLCGDIGGLYLIGVGVSALLASKSTRRIGLTVLLIGLAWTGTITAIGANKGSLTDQYAYLAGRRILPAGFAGLGALLSGIVTHPNRPIHVIRDRLGSIGGYLATGGFVGAITPWGFGVPAAVLATSSLMGTTLFIRGEPFQQFAVFPFILFGTASMFTVLLDGASLAATPRMRDRGRGLVSVVLAVAVVGAALFFSERRLPNALKTNATESYPPSRKARTLARILNEIPETAQVISSEPVMGRFGGRRYVYAFNSTSNKIPINTEQVVLVMDTVHALSVTTAEQEAAATFVTTVFRARTLAKENEVWILEWSAKALPSSVMLP